MKLAIDARPLSPKPTGIGRYTEQILLRIEAEADCQLFSDKDIVTQLHKAQLHPCAGLNIPKFLKRWLIWQQLLLPDVLKKANSDLFWSPRQQLPLLGCKKLPMILTIHDLVYHKMPETMRYSNYILEKLLLEKSLQRADHIIAISNATKQILIEDLHIPETKITLIHSGYVTLPAQTLLNLATYGITKPFILFLSTLEPRKNVDRLISAYLDLPADLQNQYQLVLAGNAGWKSEAIFKRIETLPKDKIVYLGYVNDALIYNLFKQATLFAFPSLYEGFGLPILEAMSLDCPVLTSTDPACVEVSGNAALHVDPLSIIEIQQGLKTLLENASFRKELIQKGKENIKRFSWDTSAQKHLALFKEVLISKGAISC